MSAVVQLNAEVTLVAVAPPVLQTRAPTGKSLGPVVTSLLSRPTMFQVSGVTVKMAAAGIGAVGAAGRDCALSVAITKKLLKTRSRREARIFLNILGYQSSIPAQDKTLVVSG